MLQGRTTLSPMSGVDSFVFPVVPLQGTTTVISIKTRLTWPSWTSHLLSHPPGQRNVHQGKSQAQKCRFDYCPAPVSLSYLPKAQAASCVLKHVQQSQKTKPAKCTPSHAFAIWAPHDSKAWRLFPGDLRQKEASYSSAVQNARPLPLWRPDFPRGKGLAFQVWEAKIIFDAMETKQRTIVVCYFSCLNKKPTV